MTVRRCAGCGRPLRTSRGPYGPVCAQKLTGTPPDGRTAPRGPRLPPEPSQRPTGPHTPPIDGQLAIPVQLTLGDTP